MRTIITGFLFMVMASVGLAAPVDEEDRVPIDLRRTTLVVRDIDASLEFGRDALGMHVICDNRLRTPRDAMSTADEPDE